MPNGKNDAYMKRALKQETTGKSEDIAKAMRVQGADHPFFTSPRADKDYIKTGKNGAKTHKGSSAAMTE